MLSRALLVAPHRSLRWLSSLCFTKRLAYLIGPVRTASLLTDCAPLFLQSLPAHSEHSDDEASADADDTASKTSVEPPLEDSTANAEGSKTQAPSGPAAPNYGSTSESHTPLSINSSRPSSPISHGPEPISGFTAPPSRNSPPRPSAFKLLTDPTVRVVLLSYFTLSLISTANDVIFALWMFLSIENGGVGLKVGYFLCLSAQ